MNPSDIIPRWIRELERLSAYKTQLYLYGNTKDTLFYPLGSTQQDWTLGPMREALFELLRHRLGPYDVIGAYNLVDGMVFADARDENAMAGIFDEMVGDGEKFDAQAPKGRAPQASKPKEPIEQAIQQIRSCLRNRQHPCAFILEHASQMLTTPVNLQQAERLGFLRLLMSSSESQLIAVGEGNDRRIVQNMLIFLCDKLTDLPPWLYFNNPFAGSIMVEAPRGYERRHFFNMFLPPAAQTG
ncbi:MAG TPA: hypothetical protein VHV83_00290, partial [Armatimonadota bacterium]|nr:hypothetical protein [Armatimonadota bacterium]